MLVINKNKTIWDMLMSDRQNLVDRIVNFVKDPSISISDLEGILILLNRPILEKNIKNWLTNSGLPAKMGNVLLAKLTSTRELSLGERMRLVEILGSGGKLMDFDKMLNASRGRKVKVSNYFLEPKLASWVMKNFRNENDKALLGAPTNIGKGEVAFVILGGLSKPAKGDLSTSTETIEVKEGKYANMTPKNTIHPNSFLKDMRKHLEKYPGVKEKLPVRDTTAAKGDTKNLAYLLSIRKLPNKTGSFPLAEFSKAEGVMTASQVTETMQKYHDLVYNKTKINMSKYIKSNMSFDFDSYGEDTFTQLLKKYQQEDGFSNLMYFNGPKNFGDETVFCMKNTDDAKKFYKSFGEVRFSGNDRYKLEYGYGGTYNESKFRSS